MKRQIIYAEIIVRTNAHLPRRRSTFQKIKMVIRHGTPEYLNSSKYNLKKAARKCGVKQINNIQIVKIGAIINELGYSNIDD